MKRLLAFSLLAGCLFGLYGCGDESVGNPNQQPPTAEDIEKQIKEIEADTKMPPQAKEMRIKMLRQNGTGQKDLKPSSTGAEEKK